MYFSHTQWIKAPRVAPSGQVLFAIGDVHGHADELMALHTVLRSEIDSQKEFQYSVIHLGDYIDRGPDSKKTLEILCSGINRKVDEVFLVGNHDQFLIELIKFDQSLDRSFINNWYENGGVNTMRSLQVDGYGRLLDSNALEELRARTISALGPVLVEFLKNLKPVYKIGDYVFVHAGIDPSTDLESQEFVDLLLIREPFLSSSASWKHSFCVVHGHSISMPSVHRHRVSVDAGCYKNGALCAVQIKENLLRFIAVTQDRKYPWREKLGGKINEWNWISPIDVCTLERTSGCLQCTGQNIE